MEGAGGGDGEGGARQAALPCGRFQRAWACPHFPQGLPAPPGAPRYLILTGADAGEA